MILPDLVFGRSAVTRIVSGFAIEPILLTTCCFNSCSNFAGSFVAASRADSLTITKAAIAVPLISCEIPTTAASAI